MWGLACWATQSWQAKRSLADALALMKMDASMADLDDAWSKTPSAKKPKTAEKVAAELEAGTPPVPGKQSAPRTSVL